MRAVATSVALLPSRGSSFHMPCALGACFPGGLAVGEDLSLVERVARGRGCHPTRAAGVPPPPRPSWLRFSYCPKSYRRPLLQDFSPTPVTLGTPSQCRGVLPTSALRGSLCSSPQGRHVQAPPRPTTSLWHQLRAAAGLLGARGSPGPRRRGHRCPGLPQGPGRSPGGPDGSPSRWRLAPGKLGPPQQLGLWEGGLNGGGAPGNWFRTVAVALHVGPTDLVLRAPLPPWLSEKTQPRGKGTKEHGCPSSAQFGGRSSHCCFSGCLFHVLVALGPRCFCPVAILSETGRVCPLLARTHWKLGCHCSSFQLLSPFVFHLKAILPWASPLSDSVFQGFLLMPSSPSSFGSAKTR